MLKFAGAFFCLPITDAHGKQPKAQPRDTIIKNRHKKTRFRGFGFESSFNDQNVADIPTFQAMLLYSLLPSTFDTPA